MLTSAGTLDADLTLESVDARLNLADIYGKVDLST